MTHILLNDWAMKLEEVLGVWLNFVAWSRIGFWQIEQLLCRQLLLYDKFEGVTRGNRPNWVLMPVISFSMSPFPVWHDNTRFWKARVSLLLINKNRSKTSHGDLNNTKIEGVNGTPLRRRDRKRRNIKITDWLFDKTALEFDTLIPLRRRKKQRKTNKVTNLFLFKTYRMRRVFTAGYL